MCVGDCQFKGYAVGLPAGSYSKSQLQAEGMANDDISSLRVQSGFQITVFQNDLTGNSLVLTADDSCLVDQAFNDSITAVVVAPR